MTALLAVTAGVLTSAGVYMILRRSLVKVIIGLMFLGHAANTTIFALGGLTRANPPLIDPAAETLAATSADPLPQALILTAIVIGFGVQAFAIVLFKRTYQRVGNDDIDDMKSTDTIEKYQVK